MSGLIQILRGSRQAQLFISLSFATLLCVGLLILRSAHANNRQYVWLLWNLFLAWIPALSSLFIYNLQQSRIRGSAILMWAAGLFWLVFFPNAPYLLTDLIHLRARHDAPFWFDLIVLISFAWTGFMLGLVSLVLMQEVIRRKAGTVVSWCFAFIVLALSSFGIYLGRFLRWNSWDFFLNPFQLTGAILDGARHPFVHLQTIAFSALFAFLLLTVYLTVMSVVHFRQDIQKG